VDGGSAKSGEVVSGRRRQPEFPPKHNYYFLAHLQCSLKFACKYIPWYFHSVDKLTNKKYAKTINILCAGNNVLYNIKRKGVFNPNPLRTPLGMSSHFFESRGTSYMSSAMCPECLSKEWRSKSFGLQSTPTRKQPRGCPRWRDYIFDLAWSGLDVDPAELCEIAVDREVFRVLLGLLPPRLTPKGKWARK